MFEIEVTLTSNGRSDRERRGHVRFGLEIRVVKAVDIVDPPEAPFP
jgi:hypothetical protein